MQLVACRCISEILCSTNRPVANLTMIDGMMCGMGGETTYKITLLKEIEETRIEEAVDAMRGRQPKVPPMKFAQTSPDSQPIEEATYKAEPARPPWDPQGAVGGDSSQLSSSVPVAPPNIPLPPGPPPVPVAASNDDDEWRNYQPSASSRRSLSKPSTTLRQL